MGEESATGIRPDPARAHRSSASAGNDVAVRKHIAVAATVGRAGVNPLLLLILALTVSAVRIAWRRAVGVVRSVVAGRRWIFAVADAAVAT